VAPIVAYLGHDSDAKDWQSSIDIVLRRFTEYHDLEGAFGRRAVTERTKGIFMERRSVDGGLPSRCCASTRAQATASWSICRRRCRPPPLAAG
jgi:hypothetical protein